MSAVEQRPVSRTRELAMAEAERRILARQREQTSQQLIAQEQRADRLRTHLARIEAAESDASQRINLLRVQLQGPAYDECEL